MRLSAYFGKRLHGMLSWSHVHGLECVILCVILESVRRRVDCGGLDKWNIKMMVIVC